MNREAAEMNKEAAVSVFLSGRLLPGVVVASYHDLNIIFFGGKGYCQNFAALTGKQKRTYKENNSHRLIELLAEILRRGESPVVVHGVCCALNIPTYHLLMVVVDEAIQKNIVKTLTKRMQISSKFIKQKTATLYREFYLLKRSIERNAWYRYAHEIFCLCRFLTSDFTRTIEGPRAPTPHREPIVYRRVERLIEEGFGPKYATLLGGNIVFTAYNALLVFRNEEPEVFDYAFNFNNRNADSWIPSLKKTNPKDILNPFLSGKHQPTVKTTTNLSPLSGFFPVKCAMLNLHNVEATLHVNVRVYHAKVLSKERVLYKISGKSLAFTVIKKKTMACSSYKMVEPDWCVPTSNSLNFNIHGYDLSVMTALVTLYKMRALCSMDELEPISVSHTRSSTHSFQNGVLNTNTFRQTVLERNKNICSKVPHFPAVTMLNLGILHRETVLMNVKDDVENSAVIISRIIREAAEIDKKLYTLIYELETEVKELVDNHILGMFKVAYLFGREDAARSIPRAILFDRLLVGFNPKTSKSEFADKSKFNSESKGKASKKIKLVDESKNRKNLIARLSAKFPDVFIDACTVNSRGKWSYTDKINHSPDWIFYSDFMGVFLAQLRAKYTPVEKFPSFHSMITMMMYH